MTEQKTVLDFSLMHHFAVEAMFLLCIKIGDTGAVLSMLSAPTSVPPVFESRSKKIRIHEQGVGLVKRRSMRRIMASRTKAATVRA